MLRYNTNAHAPQGYIYIYIHDEYLNATSIINVCVRVLFMNMENVYKRRFVFAKKYNSE